MRIIKKVIVGILMIVLSLSLTVKAEAASTKTAKPVVRLVNGTAIVYEEKIKKHQNVMYNFYAKEKGKWVYKRSKFPDLFGTERVYLEALKKGTYAVTATVDKKKESEKVPFNVTNIVDNKTPYSFSSDSFYTEAYGSYLLFPDFNLSTDEKLTITSDYDTKERAKNYSTAVYYVDAKAKLHFIGKKKLKLIENYGYPVYSASFKPVKGQRDYVMTQINGKGKVLGYTHFGYAPNSKLETKFHQGLPSKKMKYNSSDWK